MTNLDWFNPYYNNPLESLMNARRRANIIVTGILTAALIAIIVAIAVMLYL